MRIRRFVLGGLVGVGLLLSAWTLGRAQGLARHDFQIEISTYGGTASHTVNFICQKGCDWKITNFGCGPGPCRYLLDGQGGLSRNSRARERIENDRP
jgi:hypothetical protein